MSAGKKPIWKKMLSKLRGAVKPDTDFVHVVSAHKDADWSETKRAAVVRCKHNEWFDSVYF